MLGARAKVVRYFSDEHGLLRIPPEAIKNIFSSANTMPLPKQIPLCPPWWDEQEALNVGARHSKDFGFYITPADNIDDFWQWLPRMFNSSAPQPILVPEMLPVTTWEDNVRTRVSAERWDKLRKHCYKAAGHRCEICGTRGMMEAHESWRLWDEAGIQKLERLLCLCTLCHKAHHLGFARRLGIYDDVLRHIKQVNGWSDSQLRTALQDANDICEQRSQEPWDVDVSWLISSGIMHA